MTYAVTTPNGAWDKKIKLHWLEISSDQTYTTSAVLALDTITSSSSSSNISLSSNQVTLEAGEWVIQGSVAVDRTSTTSSYQVQFRDASTSTELVEADGWMDGYSMTADVAPSLIFQARVVLTSSLTFDVYINGSAGDVKADGTHLIIMEM